MTLVRVTISRSCRADDREDVFTAEGMRSECRSRSIRLDFGYSLSASIQVLALVGTAPATDTDCRVLIRCCGGIER